ncbi:calcium-binding protein [Novosphingobium sp. PASSN1]|uniref:calcium-binding protein n=1 Tax=Novosphingobium sp. PASSN1 TaxID=2015561 RepID=UPI000BD2DC9F|nr:calcium-binding protein [Novosphingobium sp. PASSN1]OYU34865.1 MAG: hypothetical protein CFE35_13345 [Novosphingobium sp. PASSN1]
MTYSATSGEFLINTTTTGNQKLNGIEALADGRFVALFSDASDPVGLVQKGRFFNGTTGGSEAVSGGNETAVELASGRFISVQTSPASNAITIQLLGRSLATLGDPIVVTTDTAGGEKILLGTGAVAQPAGGFVVGWIAIDVRGTSLPISYQQAFSASGQSLGDPVASPGLVPGGGTALSDGRIALFDPHTQDILIFAPNLSGTPQVVALDGAASDGGNPEQVRIEALRNGQFVVLWAEGAAVTGPLHAQVFSASGVAQSEDIIIDQTGLGAARSFDVAMLASGDFAVAWARRSGATGSEIAVKTFSSLGEEIGFQQDVNTTRASDQSGPMISALSTGGFVIGWNDQSQTGLDTSGSAVRGRTFGSNAGVVLMGTDRADALTGTTRDDTLIGLGGNDRLVGLGGRDTASYAGAEAGVAVSLALTTAQNTGGAGTDTLTGIEDLVGSRFNDALTGDARRNVLTGLAGADRLDGGAGGDRLVGGAGADVLIGGTGADVMIGGTGRDTYYVDNVGDQVIESRAMSAAGTSLGGTDTVISTVSFILPDFVEVLRLAMGDFYIDGTGNAGNNTIIGNAGKNVLDGAGGNDRLTGGADNDLFKLNAVGTGVTVITDFASGTDIIGIRNPFGSELAFGTAATTADQRLIYDIETGNIYYDADGSGSGAQVLLAVIASKPEIYGYDFMEI